MFNKQAVTVSLELGHSSHKIVRLSAIEGATYALDSYTITPHECNISLPALSESSFDDIRAISASLRQALESMGLKKGKMAVVLPDNFVLSKIISLRGPLDPDNTKEQIRSKLQAVLPLPLDKFNLSYQVVGEYNKKYIVVAEVILERHTQEIEKLVHKLGFVPVMIDCSCFTGQNLFNEYLESGLNRNKNMAFFHLGHSCFTVLVFKNGELRLSITKNIGVANFIDELSRNRQLIPKQALKIMRKETIFLPEITEEQENVENYAAIRESVAEIIRHVFAFFEYYLDRFHETRIDEIIAGGGGINMTNFLPFLQNYLNIPVKQAGDLINVSHQGKQLPADEKNMLVPAIAAAVRTRGM
ncbi:MAG: pilus assembly protein PilM [Candidatus Wallbacteria bacterium]|nr:pilus assembly protein PilM [Candidatus Wallbacteria bacterium]